VTAADVTEIGFAFTPPLIEDRLELKRIPGHILFDDAQICAGGASRFCLWPCPSFNQRKLR
jgi:hypothetical protein